MKTICKICNRKFSSIKGLSNHILRSHKISTKEYYDRYKDVKEGVCYCGKQTTYLNLNRGYSTYCSTNCAYSSKTKSNNWKETWSKTHIKKTDEEIKQKQKEYREKNKQKQKLYMKEWNKNNREKRNLYEKNRRDTDPNYKILCRLRIRTSQVLKGTKKLKGTLELLGCSLDTLWSHLESQFTRGMTKDNYGIDGWELDHIVPCDSFDLTDPEQQKKCFHYTNLQPLWKTDNRHKSNKIL